MKKLILFLFLLIPIISFGQAQVVLTVANFATLKMPAVRLEISDSVRRLDSLTKLSLLKKVNNEALDTFMSVPVANNTISIMENNIAKKADTTIVYPLMDAVMDINSALGNKVENSSFNWLIQLHKDDSTRKEIALAGKQPLGSYLTYEVDGSTTNELQSLSINGNNLSLSNSGGSVVLPIPNVSGLADTGRSYSKANSDALYLKTESDPIWNAQKINYPTISSLLNLADTNRSYSKSVSDAKYLSSTYVAPVTSVNSSTGAVNLTTSNIPEGSNLYYTSLRFNTGFSGKSTTDLVEGNNLYFTAARARAASNTDYVNSATTTTGIATFYLTSDKTSTGTALYSNVTSIVPIVNDANINYTYGWVLSGDKKTVTVTVKSSSGISVAALGLTLLGVPAIVPNGTTVQLTVKGN